MSTDKEPEVDEGLYSRQVYVLGLAAMKKMSSTRVLIVGMTGLGCEIAKNLILAGVASVTINDTNNLTWSDLSTHFYVSEDDIGKNRASVTLPKLIELNKYVQVNELQGKVTEEHLKNFEVVVFVDQCTSTLTNISQFCHENGIKFIATESRGVAGMAFCDFGKKFEIYDTDGEEVVTCLVSGVTSSNPALITVHDDHRHNLEDGQKVLITDIEGIPELNDKEWEVKVTGPFGFTIEFDATNVNYVRGGYAKPIKLTAIKDYLPLGEALRKPEFMITDFGKMDMSIQLHILFQALHAFIGSHGSLPAPYDESHALEVIEIAKGLAQEYPDVGELKLDTLLNIAKTSAGNLNPMAAFLGGFVAQEVLKASSGKFSPLNQFMYFDAVEVLPTTPPTDCSPRGCRYDGQIAVFGSQFQDLLLKNKNFLVGAGALGCEFLKNFAMMGLGASPDGQVIVTDLDNIEKSNLSRQFLFRPSHIGSAKSKVAAGQAQKMNPNLNVRFMTDKVAPETEHLFDDAFWERLDGVTNALDNVQARLYVDSKCVYYRKPLMESGTLGAKANVQVVSPYQTEPYGASRDPPEKQIPICTLKNFPNAIEHTIQWARDAFEGLFKQNAEDVNGYLTRSDFLAQLEKEPATRVTTLEGVYDALVKNKPSCPEDCVRWARFKFEEFFNHQIHQLLYNFPVDTITSSGERFWSGPKRPPAPILFDPSDPAHTDFIIAASYLRAENYGIPLQGVDIVGVAAHVRVPDFIPKKANIQIEETNNEANKPEADADGSKNLDIIKSLPPANSFQFKMKVIEFEKDDDTNHHIDFITACSNLRARNYKIPEADRSKTKLIAGKIIPAMVTTTALITGIACFEWYKILQKKPLESLRNAFVNLALPFTAFSEPVPAKKNKYGDKEWTVWDRFEVDLERDVTLKEFIDYFQKQHNLEINMISCGASIIYSFFGAKAKTQERLKKPVSEVVKEITKSEFSPSQRYINMEICCVLDDEDVDVPYVRYAFRH